MVGKFERVDLVPAGEKKEDSNGLLCWFPASEIQVTSEQTRKKFTSEDYTEFLVCNKNIKILRSENLISDLSCDDHENILKAVSQHSDLLPAVYEGDFLKHSSIFERKKDQSIKIEDYSHFLFHLHQVV